VLTFKRAVVVDTWADLKIHLTATAAKAASWGVRILILAASLLILAGFAWAARSFRTGKSSPARS
jgi:sensor domain CHASE-containing protein